MEENPNKNENATQSAEWQMEPMPSRFRVLSYILFGLAGVSILLALLFGLAFVSRADTAEEYNSLHGMIRLSLLFWGAAIVSFLAAALLLTRSWLGRILWMVFAAIVWLTIYSMFIWRLKSSH